MNKNEKIVLWVGLLLWVVGDLVTTYIALNWFTGLAEGNILTKNLFQIFLLKLGVVGFALIAIHLCEKYNLNKYKTPIYAGFIFVGAIAIINNIVHIFGVKF